MTGHYEILRAVTGRGPYVKVGVIGTGSIVRYLTFYQPFTCSMTAGACGESAMSTTHYLELQVIVTTQHDIVFDQIRLLAGSTGKVVHIYHSGLAYEVEFERPVRCVLTFERRLLDEAPIPA